MKSSPLSIHPLRRRRRGVALVIVLTMVVLVASIVIAFMSSVRSDLSRMSEHHTGRDVVALSETATSLVMAQIREATLSGIGSNGRGTHAWASQPGALRVWNSDGDLEAVYKLYSAAQMKESGLGFLATEVPTDWTDRPDDYTNLNEPVATGAAASPTLHYPILSADALGNIPGFDSTQTVVDPATITGDQRVVMPVRWLYVSRDGALTPALTDQSVGRIAFWTDDETCKVNINTASASGSESAVTRFPSGTSTSGNVNRLGLSYWGIPRTQLQQDWNFARGAPSEGEFQRYPGHPASVNLAPLLGLTGLSDDQRKTELVSLFDLFPAYRWGGSENNRIPWTLATTRTPLTGSGISNQRLYASVDELRFRPDVSGNLRSLNSFPAYPNGVENHLASLRFLLTATSRSPDLNLFGQPRVTLWPMRNLSGITNEDLYRTPQEKLIAFASTYAPHAIPLRRKEYFFTRMNPLSQTEDWANIPRNRELFAYLQNMTGRDIPGFGGHFLRKYDQGAGVAGERDQILTEIFDWIRCVNLNEASSGVPSGFQSYTPKIDPPLSEAQTSGYQDWLWNNQATYRGAGVVLPIVINHGSHQTRGAGRVPTLSEVGLLLAQGETPASGSTPAIPDGTVQSALVVETFSPMQGYMPWAPKNFQVTVKTDATLEGQPLFQNAVAGATLGPVNRSVSSKPDDIANQPVGGTDGFLWIIGGSLDSYPFARTKGNGADIPIPVPPPGVSPNVVLGAGEMEIAFVMDGVTYQTFNLEIPDATFPAPSPSSVAFAGRRTVNKKTLKIELPDVLHSVIPRDGDYRMMAYLPNVPASFFRKHPNWGDSAHQHAHSLRTRKFRGLTRSSATDGATNGGFASLNYTDIEDSFSGTAEAIASTSQFWTHRPDIPPDITDLITRGWAGDWSHGVGDFPSGAYLGKADDGMRAANDQALYYGEHNWYSGAGFFSPTQQVPSAIALGSLPTGVKKTEAAYQAGDYTSGAPWRTLLFAKNPDAGSAHYGATAPHDSLLLDLFTMPVVEPYAISEPTSTAGRINMNYQIIPFTGIQRSSALHALLSFPLIPAFPNSKNPTLQGHPNGPTQGTIQADTTRLYQPIEIAETLKQFESRFANNDIFRSATEICTLWLVPQGTTLSAVAGWWAGYRATGDNLRERPYGEIYPLLTTKSNSYTVHLRVQALAPGTHKVIGEYRGSAMIERYIDPMDERLTDGSFDPDAVSLEPLYRFRVVETKRFAP